MVQSHENPYQCTPDSVQYSGTISRACQLRPSGEWHVGKDWLSAISFPFLLLRKALGWRFKAFHGTRRPNELPPMVDSGTAQARRDFSVYENTCLEYGMEHVRTFRPPWIGGKSGVFAVWLHPDGEYLLQHHSHRHSTRKSASQADCLLLSHKPRIWIGLAHFAALA